MSEPHTTTLPTQPPDPAATGADTASSLVRVLDQYLADLQAGHAPDHAQLLAAHPELAPQLEQCLAGIEFIHQAAKPAEAPAQLGDFRIVREIGRGGMGVVYEAEQLSLKRRVALKVLRFGAAPDPEALQRFQREAETVARLHHTNIVPIFAVGCEQGVHYYAMQFIDGKSLASVLEEARVPDAREVARWGLQAAEALAHAHQRGVIHRDVKPSNLLLDGEGVVWLTDFGLARRADEVVLTVAGVLMGTPRYMSPEQAAAAKQPIDQRTDVYSLGATLYELATGRPVFDAETPQGVLTQILHAEPIGPRRLNRTLPRDLETIVLKCLAKEPAQRYATAQALADDLRAFLESRPIQARRPTLAERAGRWLRQRRRGALLGTIPAVASALLVIGAFGGWLYYEKSRQGMVSFPSESGTPAAELFDARGRMVARFGVPTVEPIPVAEGLYDMRLQQDAQLSQDYRLAVDRGGMVQANPTLGDRHLWGPIELREGETWDVVDLAGKRAIILTSDRGIRRLDGATGKQLWEKSMDAREQPVLARFADFKWVGNRPVNASGPGEVRRRLIPAEMHCAGKPALVWVCANSSSLVAASATTGDVLWVFRSSQESTLHPDQLSLVAGAISDPLVADLNGDGAPDVLVVFAAR
jgi:serine/threonine protein kinase